GKSFRLGRSVLPFNAGENVSVAIIETFRWQERCGFVVCQRSSWIWSVLRSGDGSGHQDAKQECEPRGCPTEHAKCYQTRFLELTSPSSSGAGRVLAQTVLGEWSPTLK